MKSTLNILAVCTALALPFAVNADQHKKEASDHSTNKKAVAMEAKEDAAKSKAADVRDWNAIDKDKDHYISAAEMDAYLKESWAKTGKN